MVKVVKVSVDDKVVAFGKDKEAGLNDAVTPAGKPEALSVATNAPAPPVALTSI